MGAKDVVPRSLTGSIKRIAQEVADENATAVKAAFLAGVNAPPPRSFPYLQLIASYVDGKPKETIEHSIPEPVTIRHEFAKASK